MQLVLGAVIQHMGCSGILVLGVPLEYDEADEGGVISQSCVFLCAVMQLLRPNSAA